MALVTKKIPTLIFSLGLPAVVAQVINLLYNIVDRIYIGNIPNIGHIALTGLGVTFPIIVIISAFSALVGYGGAPIAAIKMGEKNLDGAKQILSNSFLLLICLSIILSAVFFIFSKPILYLFGASDATIGYALDYISIYVCGTIFVQLALGLNPYISAQGKAKTAMFSVIIGAIINIILDPIFIFYFNLGVKGAAFATIISQACSMFWVLFTLLKKNTVLRIEKQFLYWNWNSTKRILGLGCSPFIMQATESLVIIALNNNLQRYGGDLYVGSMAIMISVMQLIVLPISGFMNGAQPVISYNFGAKNYSRVRYAFRVLITVLFSITFAAFLIVLFFPHIFVRLFTSNIELTAITVSKMPIFFAGVWMLGIQFACQGTFLGLGQAKISLFLALVRKFFLLIPLVYTLPHFWGVNSIYYAEPIADVVAALITFILFTIKIKKILPPK
ncbi:MAG: MATE family efflux transporter [Treponemataceae bacterium]